MSILSTLQPSVTQKTPEALQRMPNISHILGRVIDICLHLALFLIPLVFSTATIDVLEINKQTLLIVIVGVAVTAWFGKALADREFTFVRSWLHLSVLAFALGYLIVSFFSQDRYMSFAGSLGQASWAFSTVAALVVMYIVAVNRIRTVGQVYDYLLTFLAGSLVVSVFAWLQMMGWYLWKDPALAVKSFTTVGSIFSYSVYSAVPLVIAASLAFHGCRNRRCLLASKKPLGLAARSVVWAVLAVGIINLILINYWVAWVGVIFGLSVSIVLGLWRERSLRQPLKLIAPISFVIIAVVFMLFSKSLPKLVELPTEVAPSVLASRGIAMSSLQASPVVGSGPGTWVYDYAKFRVSAVNASPFWNVRFDRGISFILTLLATTGIIGVALWIMLVLSAFVKSWQHLVTERDSDTWFAYLIVLSGFATLVLLSLLYNLNMAHVFVFWMLLALLGSLVGRNTVTWHAESSSTVSGALAVSFMLVIVTSLSVVWLSGQRLVADIVFAGSVADFRSGANLDQIINKVNRAKSLNPWSDIFSRNLSQAYLIKASQIAQSGLSADKAGAFNQAVSDAQKAAGLATEVNRVNVDNWANLALIHQNITSFIPGSDERAIAAFMVAVELEPNNPVFMAEIGKMYLLRSDAYATVLGKDSAKDGEVRVNIESNLKQGEDWINRAIGVKPDYLPSRYYLGIIYERQGKTQDAIAELENVIRLDSKDVGVGFELAILYYRNNQKTEALDLLKQIVELEPNNANALWYLSAMYEEVGEKNLAIAELEKLVNLFPDNEAVKQRAEALKASATDQLLPEPLVQAVSGSSGENPLKR